MYTNLPTSQGYIFRILQHFATKLCSFSNFDNFFPEISFVIPRLKCFLKRKSSIGTGNSMVSSAMWHVEKPYFFASIEEISFNVFNLVLFKGLN